MKIKIWYIALAMCMIFGSVGVAAAEPSIDDILTAKYGAGYYVEEQTMNDYILAPASYTSVTIYANITADQGGWADPMGWYKYGESPINLHNLLDSPATGQSSSFDTSDKFGIYIQSNDGTIYSENSLNGKELVKLYYIDKNNNGDYADDNCFVFAFEDTIGYSSDNDYQDVVVEVCSCDDLTLIPEFPTVALPVAAVLGLMFIFGRKNEKL